MCVSGLLGRNASGRGRTWHVHARRMNMAGCRTWVLEAHGEQGVQMKAHLLPGPRRYVEQVSARGMRSRSQMPSCSFAGDVLFGASRGWHQLSFV